MASGTICDSPNFNPQEDAEVLRKAMKGIGTDEKEISMIIGNRSNSQRQVLKTKFAQMFGKELNKELRSELSGNYERVILELMMAPARHAAYSCHEAMEGAGTDEMCLIEILCSSSNAEIHALRDAYKQIYKKELEKEIQSETSGHFKRLLYSLVQGYRLEDEPIDHQKAAEDAKALYDAGVAKLGTDESRFNMILATRSFPQLLLVFDEYEKITQRTLEQAISSEMSGDLKDGMLSLIKCAINKAGFFAERLYASMKGLGTDDTSLVRIMVSRSEIDLVQIKEEFRRRYGKTLESFIDGDCSGDYKKILLQLCAGNRST